MNRTSVVGLLAALAAVIVLGWGGRNLSAEQKAAPRTARVAVVDFNKLFSDYNRSKDINQKLDQKQEEIKAQLNQKRDKIQALQAELDNLKPDSPEYQKRQDELVAQTVEFRSFGEVRKEQIVREMRQMTEEVYGDIVKACEVVANEAGYDLVLMRDDVEIQPKDEMRIVLDKIRQRKVIYAGKEIDITEAVMRYLNQSYRLKESR